MASKWRIELDTPANFAVEPGYHKARYGREIIPDPALSYNIVQEPNTGLIFLRPSFLESDFSSNMLALSDFRRATNAWIPVRRRAYGGGSTSIFSAPMISNIPGRDFALLDILIATAILAIKAGMQQYDKLEWALETQASIADDESFAIIYNISADEINRYANLMCIQWDKWQIHISGSGLLSIWEHTDRQDLNNPLKLIKRHEWELETVQGINHRIGFLVAIPCPWGLILQHQSRRPKSTLASIGYIPYSAATTMFFPLEAEEYAQNAYRLWRSDKLRVALNPTMQYIIGVQRVRFLSAPNHGLIIDSEIDPSYKPSLSPLITPLILQNGRGTVTASAKKKNGKDAWQLGDRTLRAALTLSTNNDIYTPFLTGYGIRFPPVFAVRETTPVLIGDSITDSQGYITELEYSINVYRQQQAMIRATLRSNDLKRIARRGDATGQLQEKAGQNWNTIFGGLAKEWEYRPVYMLADLAYEASFVLLDAWERMTETHLHFEGVCDNLSIKDAIDNILMGCALPISGTPPADFPNVVLPAAKQNDGWRFFPRAGASSKEMIRMLLQLASKQWIEWYLEWDATTGRFEYRKREYNPAAQPVIIPATYTANVPCAKEVSIQVMPPIANLIVVAGASGEGESAKRILAPPAINRDSIYNPNSSDYLGRVKTAILHTDNVVNEQTALRIARRAYDLMAHRRLLSRVVLNMAVPFLSVDNYIDKFVRVFDGNEYIAEGWVKRITISINSAAEGRTILELDSVWEGLVDEK